MTDACYKDEEIIRHLVLFGRAIQGIAPYDVIIEPDPAKCHGGCCSFDSRRITVNPTMFRVPAAEQYQLTKALLVHEAGHRRHTTPAFLPSIVSEFANILEDERVERLMCAEFIGVRSLIHKLAERFHLEASPINANSDSTREVADYFLHLRWATRIGQPVKGGLSARNQLLWEKVKPLVYEAWEAETSETVNRNAARIANILGIKRLDNKNNKRGGT